MSELHPAIPWHSEKKIFKGKTLNAKSQSGNTGVVASRGVGVWQTAATLTTNG